MALLDLVARRVVVVGHSMTPTLHEGDEVIVLRPWRPVRAGDLVVVTDPREPSRWLVKRVVARRRGRLELRGDNPEHSSDSRDFGPARARAVRYLVPPRLNGITRDRRR